MMTQRKRKWYEIGARRSRGSSQSKQSDVLGLVKCEIKKKNDMTFKDFEFERKIYVFYLKEMPNKKEKRGTC